MKFEPINLTIAEQEFQDYLASLPAPEDVCAAFGIPAHLLGMTVAPIVSLDDDGNVTGLLGVGAVAVADEPMAVIPAPVRTLRTDTNEILFQPAY